MWHCDNDPYSNPEGGSVPIPIANISLQVFNFFSLFLFCLFVCSSRVGPCIIYRLRNEDWRWPSWLLVIIIFIFSVGAILSQVFNVYIKLIVLAQIFNFRSNEEVAQKKKSKENLKLCFVHTIIRMSWKMSK